MVDQGIICAVGDEPTQWYHPTVVVPKSDDGVRITTDLTKLNTEVIRSIHPTKTPLEAVAGFEPSQKYFAKLDLVKGHWQMPLDEASQHLTTFLTSFGKFRNCRAPMGFVSTEDSFSLRGDVAMSGLNVHKVVVDLACGTDTAKELVRLICEILERCSKYGLTVNSKKSVLISRAIDFVGFHISQGSVQADPKKIEAIQDFPTPSSLTALRSFLGMANQLGRFCPSLSAIISPLRGLLSSKNTFLWHSDHDRAFEATKKLIASPPVLDMHDFTSKTILLTDGAKTGGLRFALLQIKNDQSKLIMCGSRFLKDC